MGTPTIEQSPDGLRVVMRAPRAGCLVAALAALLVGWTAGGIAAVHALVTAGISNPASWLLLVWLAGWLAGELFAAAALAFLINGREVLEVDDSELRLRAEALGRAWTRRYPLAEAENLRPVASSGGTLDFLAFERRGKTVRFGTDLSEADATRIAQAVWDQAPSLRA